MRTANTTLHASPRSRYKKGIPLEDEILVEELIEIIVEQFGGKRKYDTPRLLRITLIIIIIIIIIKF